MRGSALPPDEKMARKAGVASFVGTTVEWYDFYLYGTASALVFAPLYFSAVPPSIGLVLSFATFWAGFLSRPLGGIVFGHLGDRIGRRATLITTLLLMGVSATGVGLLPTYAQIGAAAPVLLTLFRFVQGLAVGGEWGGAVLIATEHAKKERGFLFGAFAQQGSPAGKLLAWAVFVLVSQALPEEAFMSWGWRVPFLASAVLVMVGLVVRLSVEESPAMAALAAEERTERVPLVALFRSHARTVLLGMCAAIVIFTVAYGKNAFALSWATGELGFAKSTFLAVLLVSAAVQFLVQPFGALLASRWNPRKTVTLLLVLELPALPLMFAMISTGDLAAAATGVILATLPDVMYYAIFAGMLAQAFPVAVRYTGVSMTYQLTGLVGGLTPLIMQSLLAAFTSVVPVMVYALITVLMSLLGARALLTSSERAETAETREDPATTRPH
ncbi:MFS transporter [Salinifilum aidingensis]